MGRGRATVRHCTKGDYPIGFLQKGPGLLGTSEGMEMGGSSRGATPQDRELQDDIC